MEKKRISVNWSTFFLALTAALLTVFVPLLCSISMLIKKTVLPETLVFGFRVVSTALAGLTLLLSFCYPKDLQDQKGHFQRILPLLKAELWLLAVFLLWRAAWYLLFDMAPARLMEHASLIRILIPVWIAAGFLSAVVLYPACFYLYSYRDFGQPAGAGRLFSLYDRGIFIKGSRLLLCADAFIPAFPQGRAERQENGTGTGNSGGRRTAG